MTKPAIAKLKSYINTECVCWERGGELNDDITGGQAVTVCKMEKCSAENKSQALT